MTRYMIIETRDPHEARDVQWMAELAANLQRGGAQAAVMLAENGVFAARTGAAATALRTLADAGCQVFADRYALRERGIRDADLAKGVKAADLDVVVDALEAGVSVMWR
jgi:sulfur transfer complex TusBCD TusB component (DsrH family)